MASLTLTAEHAAALNDLSRIATADVVALWRDASTLPLTDLTALILQEVPVITDVHGETASVMAVDHYDETRAAAGVRGTYRATVEPLASADQVRAMTRWALGPLFRDTPDYAQALANLAAGTDRLVRLPDRNTIPANARRDPQATGVQRYTSADACGFCLLMATRPDHATLTGAKPGRWHDHCRCGCTPSFGAADDWPDPREIYSEYRRVTAGLGGADARRAWDRHVRAARQT